MCKEEIKERREKRIKERVEENDRIRSDALNFAIRIALRKKQLELTAGRS